MRIQSLKDILKSIPDTTGLLTDSDLKQSETKIQSLFPSNLSEKNFEGWKPKDARSIALLARAQLFQEDLNAASATLRELKTFSSHFNDSNSEVQIQYLLESGRLLSWSMQPARAHELCTEAWRLAQANNDAFSAIDAGVLMSVNQRPKKQTEWSRVLLDLALGSDSETAKLWLPFLYMTEAWNSFDSHRFDEAYDSIQKAGSYPINGYQREFQISLQWTRGRMLRELMRYDEAMKIQSVLIQEMAEHPQKGYVHLEMGECLQLTGKIEDAQAQFSLAHKLLSLDPWYIDNHKNELDRMKYLYAQR